MTRLSGSLASMWLRARAEALRTEARLTERAADNYGVSSDVLTAASVYAAGAFRKAAALLDKSADAAEDNEQVAP